MLNPKVICGFYQIIPYCEKLNEKTLCLSGTPISYWEALEEKWILTTRDYYWRLCSMILVFDFTRHDSLCYCQSFLPLVKRNILRLSLFSRRKLISTILSSSSLFMFMQVLHDILDS
ncbi:hypothetical protein CR513_50155, partial [Mucuna pruriens]